MARGLRCPLRDGHSSCTPVARRIKQPTRTADPDRSGIAPAPFLFGLAPGGVCRAASVAGSAVRSYRTVSPLPRPNATRRGGLFSVALSLGRPRRAHPPDVIRHRLSVEPGLSSPAAFRHWRGAAVRPTDWIGMVVGARRVKAAPTTALKASKTGLLRADRAASAAFRSVRATSAASKGRQCRRPVPAGNGAGMLSPPRASRRRKSRFPSTRSRRIATRAAVASPSRHGRRA